MRPTRLALLGALLIGGLVALPAEPPAGADDIDEVRAQAQEATQELADAEARLGSLEEQISGVAFRVDEARRRMAELRGDVEELIVARYMRPERLFVPLRDINRAVRADVLARFVIGGNTDALEEYRAAEDDLVNASAELTGLRSDQQQAIEELRARGDALTRQLDRLEELERQRREAAAEARRQEEEAAAAAAAAAAEPPDPTTPPADDDDPDGGGGGGSAPPPSGGGIVCPVPSSTFVDTWGAPRSGGRRHEGVDMMASEGTPVLAPASGNVEHREVSLGGLSFYLYADDGTTYFGTHMSGYAGGGHVAAGTVIGYVGQTGNAPVPHLHFEIHPGGGEPVNPFPATSAACPGG